MIRCQECFSFLFYFLSNLHLQTFPSRATVQQFREVKQSAFFFFFYPVQTRHLKGTQDAQINNVIPSYFRGLNATRASFMGWICVCVRRRESWCLWMRLVNPAGQQVCESQRRDHERVLRNNSKVQHFILSSSSGRWGRGGKSNKRLCNQAGYFYWECTFIIALPVKEKQNPLFPGTGVMALSQIRLEQL